MSSILDALKKLEEEKQRQLKLLEKEDEEEQEFPEPISISTIAKSDSPLPIQESASHFISPKFLIGGLIILVMAMSIISVFASLWIVKTQIAKNITTPVPTEVTNTPQKTPETVIQTSPKEELPQQETVIENRETPSVSASQENKVENKLQKDIVSKPASEPPPAINTPEKTPQSETPPPKKEAGEPVQVEQPIVIAEPPLRVAKSTPSQPPTAVVEEVKKEIPPPTASPQITEETPQQSIPEPPPLEVPSPSVNTQISSVTATTESQKGSPSPPPEMKPTSVPTVVTRDLQPPPALKPEQFQQALTLPKPKAEETVDMTRLPVLRTSDRARLGLEDMKLNVLREAGPKNPHGLAIINLVKVYVGEMIPGTSVRLLDVKTHGIAIEVVGTGERYYVPR